MILLTSSISFIFESTDMDTNTLLNTIAIVFVVLWLIGMVSLYTMGGFIHLLLVIALAIILIRLFRGEKIL